MNKTKRLMVAMVVAAAGVAVAGTAWAQATARTSTSAESPEHVIGDGSIYP